MDTRFPISVSEGVGFPILAAPSFCELLEFWTYEFAGIRYSMLIGIVRKVAN
jgi:hypothetical protein